MADKKSEDKKPEGNETRSASRWTKVKHYGGIALGVWILAGVVWQLVDKNRATQHQEQTSASSSPPSRIASPLIDIRGPWSCNIIDRSTGKPAVGFEVYHFFDDARFLHVMYPTSDGQILEALVMPRAGTYDLQGGNLSITAVSVLSGNQWRSVEPKPNETELQLQPGPDGLRLVTLRSRTVGEPWKEGRFDSVCVKNEKVSLQVARDQARPEIFERKATTIQAKAAGNEATNSTCATQADAASAGMGLERAIELAKGSSECAAYANGHASAMLQLAREQWTMGLNAQRDSGQGGQDIANTQFHLACESAKSGIRFLQEKCSEVRSR